ncbi:MAG: hypothetical protein HY220_01735 [Candidatus Sungbacteria bacterium]|uniref:Lipoprotein n=1 Tax=Candidatus Sungiibacteriota bacterium TaxID=2750080 RepID=A0A9D6LTK4_9BACT|nr:hypothetical protein [Candidatus Sungbacteria bacterium]
MKRLLLVILLAGLGLKGCAYQAEEARHRSFSGIEKRFKNSIQEVEDAVRHTSAKTGIQIHLVEKIPKGEAYSGRWFGQEVRFVIESVPPETRLTIWLENIQDSDAVLQADAIIRVIEMRLRVLRENDLLVLAPRAAVSLTRLYSFPPTERYFLFILKMHVVCLFNDLSRQKYLYRHYE